MSPVGGWSNSDCTLGLDDNARNTLERGLVHRGFCVERPKAVAGILEELQRLPRTLRVAWEVFSGNPFLDTDGIPHAPRIPIEVLPTNVSDVVEEDAPAAPVPQTPREATPVLEEVVPEETEEEQVARAIVESRMEANRQRDLETQSAGAGASGSGAAAGVPAERDAPEAPETGKCCIS